jgi:protein phosphatase 1 regulatory subunit 7
MRSLTLKSCGLGRTRLRNCRCHRSCYPPCKIFTEIFSDQNLSSLKRLKILALQSNRITKIEGLEGLENLEDLYLSHNGIIRMEGLEHNVRWLGVKFFSSLSVLINLAKTEDARFGPQCRSRDRKYITSYLLSRAMGTFSTSMHREISIHSPDMSRAQLNQNRIPTLQALEPQLRTISTLETIYLEDNPCQKADVNYRRKIMLALPQLKQIDAT